MAKYTARNQQELFALISEHEGFINRTGSKNTYKENTRKIQDRKIIALAKELEADIIHGLSAYFNSYSPEVYKNRPNGLRNNPSGLFEGIEFDSENRQVLIKFANTAWASNIVKNDPHQSFVPVLLNYGWQLSGANKSPATSNMFWRYQGNNFISDAIERFNLKCANDNIRIQAKFLINGINAETIYSNGSIPYR